MHNTLMLRSYLSVIATIMAIGMVFGIGTHSVWAATTTAPVTTAQTEDHSEAAAPEQAHAEEDQGLVGLLGINWKLFIAQLINFGIVLFVLWKWVFGPVAQGLSNRTAKIESSLAEAQRIAEERETFDSWKNGEIAEVRKEAAAILTKAKQEAETVKTDLLTQTKQEQAKITASAQAQLEQEKQNMIKEVKTEIADMVVNATQAMIKAKLDPKKDTELIKQALKQAEAK